MLKQLSQPSFVNGFARSRGESVRPDLWFDNMWCPALGNQGAMLYDVAQRNNAALSGTYSYSAQGLALTGDNYGLTATKDISTWAGSFTLFATYKSSGTGNQVFFINTDNFNWGFYIGAISTKFRLSVILTGAQKSLDSTAAVTDGLWHTLAGTFDAVSGTMSIYVDGLAANTPATYSGTIRTTTADSSVLFAFSDQSLDTNGSIGMLGFARLVLTPSQIMSLTADPLLPLRRKKIWSMYVPAASSGFKPYWYRNKNILIGA